MDISVRVLRADLTLLENYRYKISIFFSENAVTRSCHSNSYLGKDSKIDQKLDQPFNAFLSLRNVNQFSILKILINLDLVCFPKANLKLLAQVVSTNFYGNV